MPSSDNTQHQKYYSRECRDKANAKRAAEYDKERRALARAIKRQAALPHGLEACVKEAARLGVSYGKYMAGRAADDGK